MPKKPVNRPKKKATPQPITAVQDQEVRAAIRDEAALFPDYGYRKIKGALERMGFVIGKNKVRALMKEENVLLKRNTKGPGRGNDPASADFPNLIKDLEAESINEIWVSDTTSFRTTDEGDGHVAAVMDYCSRKCLGHSVSSNNDTALTLSAQQMAMDARSCPKGVIHHSDQGSPYKNRVYIEMLKDNGFRISMSRKGYPYDNARMERFMRTLKSEEINRKQYRTIDEARREIAKYIETYNTARLHANLGNVPPDEFEDHLKKS